MVSDPAPGVQGPGARGEAQACQKSRRRGSYLPRELCIKLYEEVNRLRRKGLTYKGIVDEIRRRYGFRLSKSLINYWLRGIHRPYNGRYIPSIEFLEPSEELAYVIGVKLGDGYVTKRRRVIKGYNQVRIGLKVKDREFAVEFARCLAKVLGRHPIRPRYIKSSGRYVVEVRSQTLYELLKKPVNLDRLKEYIEHCDRCMAAFVRGFVDSEGCVNEIGYIDVYNADLPLLVYLKGLLRRLDIESTGPRPKNKQGKTFYDPWTEKTYPTQKRGLLSPHSGQQYHELLQTRRLHHQEKTRTPQKPHQKTPSQTPFPSSFPFNLFPFFTYIISIPRGHI